MDDMVKKDRPNRWGLAILAVLLIGGGAFLIAAWNSGRQQAAQDDAFRYPCRLATESPSEEDACVASMIERYEGPIDDPQRVANAVAEHVRRLREGSA